MLDIGEMYYSLIQKHSNVLVLEWLSMIKRSNDMLRVVGFNPVKGRKFLFCFLQKLLFQVF